MLYDNICMNFFAENLKTLRKESGLLQRELADKLHLTKNAVFVCSNKNSSARLRKKSHGAGAEMSTHFSNITLITLSCIAYRKQNNVRTGMSGMRVGAVEFLF